MDLFVKSIDGKEEMLTDFEVTRNDSVNGDKKISISLTKTDENKHAYHMVYNENILIYDNEEYIIKVQKERTLGTTLKKECQAIHRMFDDLKNNYIYEETSGTLRIVPILNFALEGSGYTFSVDDTDLPLSVLVENFGDDNSLALFKSVLERFGAEFDIIGTHIYISRQMGRLTDNQIRYKLNINSPQQEIDTSSFATYIRGYGKINEDGTYVAEQEYTSPLAEIYGIKHAKPVRDERVTDNVYLFDRIKRELNDSMDISLSLNYIQLEEMGITDIRKGDYIWCIIEPFDIDVRIRVMDVEDYSSPFKSPKLTIGTIAKTASDVMTSFNATKGTVNKVIDSESNTVRQRALSQETNYVVDAIERTFAQIDYTDDISVTDPVNFMRQVGLRKGGIYRTSDGYIYDFVITPDGLDLSQVFGRLSQERVSIGAGTVFDEGYDPTQINVPSYELATPTANGLMSKEDKTKINQILVSEIGQVIDLSFFVQKINELEQRILDLEGDGS